MGTTRQIYWNVGHGVVIPMYILVFLAIVLLVYNFKKGEVYKKGKYVDRFSNWPDRLSFFIENTLGQIKVLNVPVGIFMLSYSGDLLFFL